MNSPVNILSNMRQQKIFLMVLDRDQNCDRVKSKALKNSIFKVCHEWNTRNFNFSKFLLKQLHCCSKNSLFFAKAQTPAFLKGQTHGCEGV